MKDAEKLKRLARRYAAAYADLTWIGSMDPDDHPAVRERHRKARRELHAFIEKVVSQQTVRP